MKFGVVNWEILFFKVTVFFHWNLEFENLNVNLLVGTVQYLCLDFDPFVKTP